MANGSSDLIVQIVVGTVDELAKGHGEVAVTLVEACARVRVCERTFRKFMEEGIISSCGRFGKTALFKTADVEKLRRDLSG
jgi:hypothetical protein